jgi:hypothetical protein
LPYPKGNRDEWISKSELERLSGPFVYTDENKDPEEIRKSLKSLNDYFNTKIHGCGSKSSESKSEKN